MDTESKSTTGQPVDWSAFYDKCKNVDSLFYNHGLSRIELCVPDVGLFAAGPSCPIAQITRKVHDKDILVKPMKYVVSFDATRGLQRCLDITLTKPMQFGCGQRKGFIYTIVPRKDVVISRLVVNLADLETAINNLIAEGNRYYFLYCHPY
jgi:hypothetical protein